MIRSAFPRARRPLPLLLLPLLAGGCAGVTGAYPSLAPRPIERRVALDEPADTPAPAAQDPALEADVRRLGGEVDAAIAGWAATERSAAPVIERARGVAAGGEAWVAGQQSLSALDAARGDMAGAVRAIDDLRLARLQAEAAADTTSLDALWDRAQAADAAQAGRRQALAALLAD